MSGPCDQAPIRSRNIGGLAGGSPGDSVIVGPDGNPVPGPTITNFQGEWVPLGYNLGSVVTHLGSLYYAYNGALSGDEPGAYEFRGIPPQKWLADGEWYVDAIGWEDPQVYVSTLNLPQVMNSCKLVAFRLIETADVTIETADPGSGTMQQMDALVFYQPSGVTSLNFPVSPPFAEYLFTFFGDSTTLTGLLAGVYFVVLMERSHNKGAIAFKATSSGSPASIGPEPYSPWVLLARSPVQRSVELYRGKTTEETFVTSSDDQLGEDFPGSDSYTVEWANKSQSTLRLTDVLNTIEFNPPGSNDADQPLRLTLINENGSGSISPTLWTDNPEIDASGMQVNGGVLPTELGPNPGDMIIVYFHWISTYNEIAGQQKYQPMVFWATPLGSPGSGPPPPVTNDDFVNAIELDALGSPMGGIEADVDNQTFTMEAGEPDITSGGGPAAKSAWYKITIPAGGPYTLNLDLLLSTATPPAGPSTFDTVLGLYTGTDVASLTPIATGDDTGGDVRSSLSSPVTGGVEYHIQCASFSAFTDGVFRLRWSLTT